jgi:hypothetical protein
VIRGRLVRIAAACLVLAASLPAAAHDSWLAATPGARGSAFAMSTGNRFPVAEIAPPAESLAAAGCVDAQGRKQVLRAAASTANALGLQTVATGALACWAELRAFDVTLDAKLVEVYLREVQPAESVRSAWAAQLEQGLPWRERYRKFARIERGTGGATHAQLRRLRTPIGLPAEIVVNGDAPLRTGEVASFRVLTQGQPVAGLSVELVSERSRFGVWARTDAQGQVTHRLPFAGNWLLRAVMLEPDEQPGRWNSRFVTLAFEVD